MGALRFTSRNDWTVTNFRFFLHQLNVLYNRLYVITELKHNSRASLENLLNGSHSRVSEHDSLRVDYIEIHSPGGTGFSGKAGVVEQIRLLIKDFKYGNRLEELEKKQDIIHQAEMNELEIEEKKTEIALKQMEVGKMQVDIWTKAGVPTKDIQNNIGKIIIPAQNISSIMSKQKMHLLDEDDDA